MNIKELANQAGLAYDPVSTGDGKYWIDAGYIERHLERFAELVAEAEREACAKHYLAIMRDAVEQATSREREACAKLCLEQDEYGCGQYATAIRARGEK